MIYGDELTSITYLKDETGYCWELVGDRDPLTSLFKYVLWYFDTNYINGWMTENALIFGEPQLYTE